MVVITVTKDPLLSFFFVTSWYSLPKEKAMALTLKDEQFLLDVGQVPPDFYKRAFDFYVDEKGMHDSHGLYQEKQ